MIMFVYGTLKKGYGNNRLLRDAEYIGEGVLQGYMAYDCGFPVAMPDEALSLSGEFYQIGDPDDNSILRSLDRLEGEGRMYIRETVTQDGATFSFYRGHPDYWIFDWSSKCPIINGVSSWGRSEKGS